MKAAEAAAKEAKKAGKTKTKEAKSDPSHETKSESKSDRDQTAYRKRVASKIDPFIKNVGGVAGRESEWSLARIRHLQVYLPIDVIIVCLDPFPMLL